MAMPRLELTGQVFGKLHVIGFSPMKNHVRCKRSYWKCFCECNPSINFNVRGTDLNTGHSTACVKCRNITHGLTSRLINKGINRGCYNRWVEMKQRCENPNHRKAKYYYEKGIKVCNEWQDPIKFIEWATSNGFQKSMHVHRKDNSKGYFPENCMWLSPSAHAQLHANERTLKKLAKAA